MPQTNRTEDKTEKLMKAVAAACMLTAVFCALYFIVIIIYAGIGTAYCLVWPFFSFMLLLMWYFVRSAYRGHKGMPRFIPTFIFTTFCLFAFIFVLIMSAVLNDAKDTGEEEYIHTDYVVVLGARVYSNGVSKTLMYRLERALSYYEEHPETTLVLTGGQDKGDAIPEALAMFNYFSMNGVPSSRMIIDTSGDTTAELISRAIDRIYADVERRQVPKGPGDEIWPEDYVPTIGIITSDYHMMRAEKVIENQGVEEPVAIPARSDRVLFLHQCVRESAAIIKDYLMGNFTLNERELSFGGNTQRQ